MNERTIELEEELNDFDFDNRTRALRLLETGVQTGAIGLPEPDDVANMHCHTFYSFNALGYSPSSLAWLGIRNGYKLMGIVDFDVLDAVDEFLDACGLLGLRGSAGMDTPAFIPEFADRVINSPGEPGVTYHMGIGFTSSTVPTEVAPLAADLRARARQRNLSVVERVNAFLSPVYVDYTNDVLPLTPAGNATERHIVSAYVSAAKRIVPDPITFWSDKLVLSTLETEALMADSAAFQNAIRSILMKRGGVGYVQPGPDTFPSIEEFHKLIKACGALPCAAWLDGTSAGEEAIEELLDLLISKGVVALNIVPDRNWNIADPKTRAKKIAKLYEIVEFARQKDLPLNIGTEMNSYGQKLVDDFEAQELRPVRDAFLQGAYFIYGHTMLQRYAGLGYQSAWAQNHLPTRRERNAFYKAVGYALSPGPAAKEKVENLDYSMSPDSILLNIRPHQENNS